eukprot:8099052-Ditylum_brightwellii.AAC.1
MEKPLVGKSVKNSTFIDFENLDVLTQADEVNYFANCTSTEVMEDVELVESFLNHPPLQVMQNPITMLNIQQHQFQDLPLNQLQRQQPELFPVKFIDGRPLICSCNNINNPEGLWRIALSTVLFQPVVAWYHFVLGHCGTNRLYDTIHACFRAPDLQRLCK